MESNPPLEGFHKAEDIPDLSGQPPLEGSISDNQASFAHTRLWDMNYSTPSSRLITPEMPTDRQATISVLIQLHHILISLKQRVVRLEQYLPPNQQIIIRQEEQRPNRLSRPSLEGLCMSTWRMTPRPRKTDINALLFVTDEEHPEKDRQRIRSQIFWWFRKQRENAGARLWTAFLRAHPELVDNPTGLKPLIQSYEQGQLSIDGIVMAAQLSFSDREMGQKFIFEKLYSKAT